MHLVNYIEESPALTKPRLLDGLPAALKTSNNLKLLKTYFLIPQPSVRRFVLSLFARIAGDGDTNGCGCETEYLLTHYNRLSTGDMREKMFALVRQVCIANRGDIENLYEAPDS